MNRDELKRIEERWNNSTPGKWPNYYDPNLTIMPGIIKRHGVARPSIVRSDADFIEYAHNEDIPALLAYIRELEEER